MACSNILCFLFFLLFIYEIVRVCVLRVLFAFARCFAHLARCLALRRERSTRDWRFPCSLFNETLCFYFSFHLFVDCTYVVYTKLCVCVCVACRVRVCSMFGAGFGSGSGSVFGAVCSGTSQGVLGNRSGALPSRGTYMHAARQIPERAAHHMHACHTPECAAHPNASSESNSRVVGSKQ